AALFYILAMYCYLRGRSTRFPFRKTLWFLGCGLSGLLSLGSKEIAAMLPVSLILYEWLLLHNPEKPPTAAASFRKPLLLVLLAALGILAFLFGDWHGWMEAYRGRPFTLHQRLLTEPRVFVFYISLLLYPTSSRLSLLHDIEISRNALEPWTTLPAILICIGLGAAAGCLRRRHPLIAYCLLFFLLNHLIEGSIIPLELIFEHRNYLPSMLFFLPLAILFFLVRRHLAHRPALEYLFFLLPAMWLFSNGHTVYMRNRLFLDETAFWQDIVRKAPRLSISHLNLGKCYWNTGFFQKAMDEYLTAAKLNRFMHRDQAGMLFYNAGLYQAYYANDYRTALRLFVKALETHSGHQEIWYEIIRLNALMGNRKQALRHADQALRHWPEEPALLSAASVVYFQEGDLEKALTLARKARETEPQSVAALGTMAEIFRVKGQPELAVFYWEQVAVLEPDNLGAVLALIELSVGLADEQSQDKWVGTLERHACWKKSIAPRQCLEAFQRNGLLTAYKPDAAVISAAVHDTRTRNHRAPS
ncbi:MAG: tetratricopeptide repeat protein, partial [Thermodesulfobacteriota bacterium]